ncbi:MAG: RloB family protein [Melioribacteraceae bacterium]|nr:RloB family protein [Melioribacteraceae bacterium]
MKQLGKRILILSEDKKSSQYYFKSFKKDEKLKRKLSAVDIEVYQPEDYSPVGLVIEAIAKKKEAKKANNEYDLIWVVLDKDGHANMTKAYDMAVSNDIKFGLSIKCFEYWIILHFEKTRKAFTTCDEAIKHLKKNHIKDYEKSNNVFDELKPLLDSAIKNGKWLEKEVNKSMPKGDKIYNQSAYTKLHELVEFLIDPYKS